MSNIGKIYINGLIGYFEEEEGKPYTELVDVVSQVKRLGEVDSYEVHIIDSPGGYVDEGFEIYDYLKTLGKPIHTVGQTMVASIATVIFMAGQTRQLKPRTEFMIHLPSGGVQGTSEEIAEYAESIEKTEKKIIKFYEAYTGIDKEVLKSLLSKETFLNPDKAYSLGFANVETEALKAVAFYKSKNNTMSKQEQLTSEDKSWIEERLENFAKLFGTKKPANIIISDAAGVEIDFPDVAEGEDITTGAMATVDGAAAEGEYVLPSGETYVFTAGELTEIIPAEETEEEEETEEANEEMDALKKEVEELKEANTTLETELETAKTEKEEVEANLETAKADFVKFQQKVTSKFGLDTKKEGKKEEAKKKSTSAASAMKANLKRNRG